jgi:ion channel-forming bestrophin family protein
MVTYNPKDWLKLIFRFHKSDTIRILFPSMVLLGAITAAACYAEKSYIQHDVPSLTIFHQISGFVISLVLVFRINTAYDRWWEGRKLWGSLINNARNLAIKFHSMLPAQDQAMRQEIADLISNFAFSLRNHLRDDTSSKDIVFTASLGSENYSGSKHKPNVIAGTLNVVALAATRAYPQTKNDYLLVNENISQFVDIGGACERIRNTPIPFSYSIFIKKFVFLYIITMPVSFGLTIGYWSVPIVMIMFYAFASLELLSEEIEDPFGTDSNDLPTDEISQRIRTNVNEILLGNAGT